MQVLLVIMSPRNSNLQPINVDILLSIMSVVAQSFKPGVQPMKRPRIEPQQELARRDTVDASVDSPKQVSLSMSKQLEDPVHETSSSSTLYLTQLRPSPFSRLIPTRGLTNGVDSLCMHFIKFGTCKHSDQCRHLHDTGKVQLCRAYLRGDCQKGDSCPLSHDRDPDRMPECGRFLRGLCFDSNCRYVHVKKGSDSPDCVDFFQSYCKRGKYCPHRHYVPQGIKRRDGSSEEEEIEEDKFNEEEELDKAWDKGKTMKWFT